MNKIRTYIDTWIRFMSNLSTEFTNNILSTMKRYSKKLEITCITIFGRTKRVKYLTWISQVSWSSNYFLITADIMNIDPCVYFCLPIVIKEGDEEYNFRCDKWFLFVPILHYLHVLKDKYCSRDSFYRDIFISFLSLGILPLKSSIFLLVLILSRLIQTVSLHSCLLDKGL